jgi:hypothetical protein
VAGMIQPVHKSEVLVAMHTVFGSRSRPEALVDCLEIGEGLVQRLHAQPGEMTVSIATMGRVGYLTLRYMLMRVHTSSVAINATDLLRRYLLGDAAQSLTCLLKPGAPDGVQLDVFVIRPREHN